VPVIAESLAGADVRAAALAALKQLGPEARDAAAWVANLLAIDKNLRLEAVSVLEAMKLDGPSVEAVAPKLIDTFAGEKSQEVRDKLAAALGKMGKPALMPLQDALRHPSSDVRRGAATSLAVMGAEAKDVLPKIREAAEAETDPTARAEELAAARRLQAAPAPK
jgi:HEAT repeat protein